MSLRRFMCLSAGLALVATVALVGWYAAFGGALVYALAITAGTIFYHFAMRLAVGYGIDACLHNRADHTRWWFGERSWEKAFYRLLRVPRWKRFVPTFDPATFDAAARTPEELVGATCQAELVHEVIMLLSFLPMAASVWFDAFAVFTLTSCAAALIDGVFVILQRYNRPKLLRLIARRKSRSI